MIPTTFDYARATSLDDALAKLKAADGGGKFIAGGHSLVPLMKLRLSEPQVLIDIAASRTWPASARRDGKIEIGAGTVHHDVATSALLQQRVPGASPRPPRRSAIRRSAIAARSAAAWRTPIRRPTIRR